MNDLHLLIAQLHTDETRTRLAAIKALQRFSGTPEVIAALEELLHDDSQAIVRASALALGKLGDCHQVPVLLTLLDHDSEWVRKATVYAIGQTGCQAAVPDLVRLLGDEQLNSLTREALVALKVDPDFF